MRFRVNSFGEEDDVFTKKTIKGLDLKFQPWRSLELSRSCQELLYVVVKYFSLHRTTLCSEKSKLFPIGNLAFACFACKYVICFVID